MDTGEKDGGKYLVEVSGWDLNENFFVEKTMLFWEMDGRKKVLLRTPLAQGTLVFVRLSADSSAGKGFPVTYQVQRIGKIVSEQGREVQLERLHPSFSEPKASDVLEVHTTAKS